MDPPAAECRRQVDPDARSAGIAAAAVSHLVGSAAEGDKMKAPSLSRSDSRAKVLERVHSATRTSANSTDIASIYAGLPRTYVRAGKMSAPERVALMIE